jgi:hypothetical protein
VAVAREVESGAPSHVSTSYVERSNLTLRMSSKRFARLSNCCSKKLEAHRAAVSLYVAHYNLRRVHKALRSTPAMALGITDRVWAVVLSCAFYSGELGDFWQHRRHFNAGLLSRIKRSF